LVTLDSLPLQTPARVAQVAESPVAAKLAEMGLIPEQNVMVVFKAPLGDPIAVQVADYVLSLRKKEARLVTVNTEQA